jgi:hypothetical protein
MNIQFFNGWYFFWLIISAGMFVGLYALLRNKSEKTQKTILMSILIFGIALHFLKMFFPPYSTDVDRWYRDSWFVNICGANILLFPIIYMSKSKSAKDYMFFIGVISGLISVLAPLEPMQKANQAGEWLDIVRFYLHHNMLWLVPMFMVLLKHHTIDYSRTWKVPVWFLGVMLFIMLNQIFQSELGFIPMRGSDIFCINYKNSSLIWGPDGGIGDFLAWFCPDVFKTIPVGEYAGHEKYWPWFWLIVPMFVIVLPIVFAISLIFDYKHFKNDLDKLINWIKTKFNKQNLQTVNSVNATSNDEINVKNQPELAKNENKEDKNSKIEKVNGENSSQNKPKTTRKSKK